MMDQISSSFAYSDCLSWPSLLQYRSVVGCTPTAPVRAQALCPNGGGVPSYEAPSLLSAEVPGRTELLKLDGLSLYSNPPSSNIPEWIIRHQEQIDLKIVSC